MERVSGSVPFYLLGNDLSFPLYSLALDMDMDIAIDMV